jgi:hypothetical protein
VRGRQLIYLATLAIWGALVIGHLAWHLRQAFGAMPTDEVYANSIAFQLVAFALTRFPYWLVCLVGLLLAEFFFVRRR